MDSFKIAKIAIIVPVMLELFELMAVLGDLNLFYYDITFILSVNFILFLMIYLIRFSPLLLYFFILISRFNTEVEQKMKLYGILLLLYALLPMLRILYFVPISPRRPSSSDLTIIDSLVMLIMILALIFSSIRLPTDTSALRRHRVIAFAFQLVLILGIIDIINVLPMPTTFTNPEIFGAITSLLYTLLLNLLLFVLVDSTERVFDSHPSDDMEQKGPDPK